MKASMEYRSRGFTIVEMVIAIAVIAILTAVIAPPVDRMLNDSHRETISANVMALNDALGDGEQSVSFPEAYAQIEALYANGGSQFVKYLGINKKLKTAVLYDSEESRWVYVHMELTDNIVDEIAAQYGQARYVLSVQSPSQLREYATTGLSLGLLCHINAGEVRGLLDDGETLRLSGGLVLNGYTLSGVTKLVLGGDGLTADFSNGKIVGKTTSQLASITIGQKGQCISAASLFMPEQLPEDKTGMQYGVVAVESVDRLTVSGCLQADSLQLTDASAVLLPDTIVSVTDVTVDGEDASITAGTMRKDAQPVAFQTFHGGTLQSDSFCGTGKFCCGPIQFASQDGVLVPVKVQVNTATMMPDTTGQLWLPVERNGNRLFAQAFGGALTYSVSLGGELTLYSVLLSDDLRLYSPKADEDWADKYYRVYPVTRGGQSYQIIAMKDRAVAYAVSHTGELKLYCVYGDKYTLQYQEKDLAQSLQETGALPMAEGDEILLYTLQDGAALYYYNVDENQNVSYTASGFYYVRDEATLSTEYYHTITFYLYHDGIWVKNTESVKHGGAIYLSMPSRLGYVFRGWYDNANFAGESLSYGERVSGVETDMAFYARWEADISQSITLSLDALPQEDITVVQNGLVFFCHPDGTCTFAQKLMREGETVAVGNGEDTIYQFSSHTSADGKTYYEIWRTDTKIVAAEAFLPTVTIENGVFTVTCYGEDAAVTLPRPAEADQSFVCWTASGGMNYASGESVHLTKSTDFTAKWTKRGGVGLSLAITTTDGGAAEITGRSYQWDGKKFALTTATITKDQISYQLTKNADGIWNLEHEGTMTPLSAVTENLGFTEAITILSGDEAIAMATVSLGKDGTQFAVSVERLFCNGAWYAVADGALQGGKFAGSVAVLWDGLLYDYTLSGDLNDTIRCTLVALRKEGVVYPVVDGYVTIDEVAQAVKDPLYSAADE